MKRIFLILVVCVFGQVQSGEQGTNADAVAHKEAIQKQSKIKNENVHQKVQKPLSPFRRRQQMAEERVGFVREKSRKSE